MLFAVDVDWQTIITAVCGAVIMLVGALSKNFNDVVKTWFTAKAEAKVLEAKAKTAADDAAFNRLNEAYDRIDRELTKTKDHIARQDTYTDALTDAFLQSRQEHALCQAENKEWRAYWMRHKEKIESAGVVLEPFPQSHELTPEQKQERDFKLRQLEQARRMLKAVGTDLLTNDPYPTPHVENGGAI